MAGFLELFRKRAISRSQVFPRVEYRQGEGYYLLRSGGEINYLGRQISIVYHLSPDDPTKAELLRYGEPEIVTKYWERLELGLFLSGNKNLVVQYHRRTISDLHLEEIAQLLTDHAYLYEWHTKNWQ